MSEERREVGRFKFFRTMERVDDAEGKYVLFSDYQALQEELKEESQRIILWRKDCERLEEERDDEEKRANDAAEAIQNRRWAVEDQLRAAEAKLEQLKQEVDLWATRAEAAERELAECEAGRLRNIDALIDCKDKLHEEEVAHGSALHREDRLTDELAALRAGVEAILNSDGGLEAMYEELTDLLGVGVGAGRPTREVSSEALPASVDSSTEEPKGEE